MYRYIDMCIYILIYKIGGAGVPRTGREDQCIHTHTNTHTHTHKIGGAGVPRSGGDDRCIHTHTHTHTQSRWCRRAANWG
jgi:hypothetical protein